MIRLKEYVFIVGFPVCARWIIDPQVVFFSDEAWFPLRGEVNSPNSQDWSAENSGLIREVPLHDNKKTWRLVCGKCMP